MSTQPPLTPTTDAAVGNRDEPDAAAVPSAEPSRAAQVLEQLARQAAEPQRRSWRLRQLPALARSVLPDERPADPSPVSAAEPELPIGSAPRRRVVVWMLAPAVLLVVAVVLVVARRPPPIEQQLPMATGSTGSIAATDEPSAAPSDRDAATDTTAAPAGGPAPAGSPAAQQLVVHVAGAVSSPGVVRLPAGARVVDAVSAAGGLRADADPDRVNLAAALVDGQRVVVPVLGQPAPAEVVPSGSSVGATAGGTTGDGSAGGAPAASPAGPIDLNGATAEQLDTLPGVGPSTAAAILAHREQHGPFTSVDELLDVRGIGEAKLEALRDLVTVGP